MGSLARLAERALLVAGGLLCCSAAAHAGPGRPLRALWLEPARVYGHKVWFPDELEPIADAVAEVLARPKLGGYRVIPNQEMRSLWAAAQHGQLPGRKAICAAPPPPALLGEIVHPDALSGSIEVRCEKSICKLGVDLFRREPAQTGERRHTKVARLGAELPSREDPGKWAERIRRTGMKPRPREREEVGGLGLVGSLNEEHSPGPGPRVALAGVEQSDNWAYTLDSGVFAPKAKELHACMPDKRVWRDWWAQPTIIEVNPDGRLSRCEFTHPDHLPPPEHRCQCNVLGGVGFGAGAAQRRASFELRTIAPAKPAAADAYVRNAHLSEKQADDPSAILGNGEIDNADLIACLAPIRSPMRDLKAPVRFAVGRDGEVREARATWPSSLSPAVTACLDTVLGGARFNCPLSGQAEVKGELSISVWAR